MHRHLAIAIFSLISLGAAAAADESSAPPAKATKHAAIDPKSILVDPSARPAGPATAATHDELGARDASAHVNAAALDWAPPQHGGAKLTAALERGAPAAREVSPQLDAAAIGAVPKQASASSAPAIDSASKSDDGRFAPDTAMAPELRAPSAAAVSTQAADSHAKVAMAMALDARAHSADVDRAAVGAGEKAARFAAAVPASGAAAPIRVAALTPAELEAPKPTNMPTSAELALPKAGEGSPAGAVAAHGRRQAALARTAKLLMNPWRPHAR
jgi:hypothetical protein